jgi:hypothetical protein
MMLQVAASAVFLKGDGTLTLFDLNACFFLVFLVYTLYYTFFLFDFVSPFTSAAICVVKSISKHPVILCFYWP